MKKTLLMGAAFTTGLFAMGGLGATAMAQDGASEGGESVFIVTGTRRDQRSAADVVAPVDVIGGDELVNQGDNDIQNILRTSVPSFNVNTQPISDAATIIRPANLRGLSPDNTLVLLNGKRHHRAAVITFLGGGIADGSQGPDISSFPAIGLKQVDVLRDGASSQYGSDAIAGVINFVMKDASEGLTMEAKYGSTYEGDGTAYQFGANAGFAIGDNGFLNLSGEIQDTEATSRSVQRDDAAALIAAGNTDVREPFAQIWGQPEVRDDIKLMANFGVDLNDDTELYAFATKAERTTEGGFFFRNPTNRGGVYAGPLVDPLTGAADPSGVASVLVGDLSTADTGDCPAGIPLTAGGGLLPDPTILAAVGSDPNCFSFANTIPGGFTPQFGGELEDQTLAFGVRGDLEIGNGLGYDVSYVYGNNQIDFFINNTVNASLGPNTPRDFKPGGYEQTEKLFNLDFTYGVDVGFASDLNIAFGYENREEEFEVKAGDPASYALGPLATPGGAYPTAQGFSSSSNGFGGFTPASAGSNSQESQSFYVDLEADVYDSLTLQGAVRFEDYDAFGETTNYKIGGLWKVADNLSLRSTFSTGFHAPTAGQANVINVTTQFSNGQLQDQGTFPLNSPAGQIAADYIAGDGPLGLGLDRPVLGPEESENFTLGAAFSIGDADVTIDYFNIELEDRIALSSQIDFFDALTFFADREGVDISTATATGEALALLDTAGALDLNDFTGFEDLTAFGFFNNDFDTKTTGIDIIVTKPLNFTESGNTNLAVAINKTKTEVTDAGATVSPTRIKQLEENLPEWRGNATITHDQGPWRGLLRANYYGSFYEAHLDDGTLPINADSEITFDSEIGYQFTDRMEFIVGARNMFDSFPDDNPFAGIVGSKYPATAPGGFNGGSYYVKLRFTN